MGRGRESSDNVPDPREVLSEIEQTRTSGSWLNVRRNIGAFTKRHVPAVVATATLLTGGGGIAISDSLFHAGNAATYKAAIDSNFVQYPSNGGYPFRPLPENPIYNPVYESPHDIFDRALSHTAEASRDNTLGTVSEYTDSVLVSSGLGTAVLLNYRRKRRDPTREI